MTKFIKLGVEIGGIIHNANETAEIPMRILTTGEFVDMHGTAVTVDKSMLDNITRKYNEDLLKTYEIDRSAGRTIPADVNEFINRNAPIQQDHLAGTVGVTTGHHKGRFSVKELSDGGHGIFGIGCIYPDYIKQLGKQLINLSIQFDLNTFEHIETSWVTKGADARALAILGKGYFAKTGSSEQIALKLFHNIDTIRLKQNRIVELEHQIGINARLVILCKRRKITKGESRLLNSALLKSPNAVEILNALDEMLPVKFHRGNFIPRDSNADFYKKIYFQGDKMSTELKGNSTEEILRNLPATDTNAALGTQLAKGSSEEDEDKKEFARHKKELINKMSDCYDKGDAEMGKKYREKLSKLMEDEEKGSLSALSDYEVEQDGGKGEESKKLMAELAKVKEEKAALENANTGLKDEMAKLQSSKNPGISVSDFVKQVQDLATRLA
jgi:hypothetical protein